MEQYKRFEIMVLSKSYYVIQSLKNKESVYYQECLFSHLRCGLHFWGGYVVLLLVTIAKNYVKVRQVHQGVVRLCPKIMIPQ